MIGCFLMLLSMMAAGEVIVGSADRSAMPGILRGLECVRVLPEIGDERLDATRVALGITREWMARKVELRLRKAGIRVGDLDEWDSCPSFLHLNLVVFLLGPPENQAAFYHYRLILNEWSTVGGSE